MTTAWAPTIEDLAPAKEPELFMDVTDRLARLIRAYGQAPVAQMLGVDRSTITRWQRNDRKISQENAARIIDVDDIIVRTHQVFNPKLASRWLIGHEPLLGGARPIDALALRGPEPVISALNAIRDGGFA